MFTQSTNLKTKIRNPINLARAILKKGSANDVFFIHYSCENFYNPSKGTLPNITSISLHSFKYKETKTFSAAEALDSLKISKKQSIRRYRIVEKTFIGDFFKFLSKNPNAIFVHWNMHNPNFGFQAIYAKFRSFDELPVEIPPENTYDFSEMMKDCFSDDYCDNPKLIDIIKVNYMDRKGLLDGLSEAECFNQMEFAKVKASNIHKTEALSKLFILFSQNKIKTRRGKAKIYDSWFISFVKGSWKSLVWILGAFLAVVAVLSNLFGASQGLCDILNFCLPNIKKN